MSKDSPAKEKFMEAAQQLMRTKGFGATSVDEICEAAGLSKGSFFYYFESKEHLAKAILERYSLFIRQKMQEAPFRKNGDALQRVYGYVDFNIQMVRDPVFQKGCLLGTLTQELADTHPEIRSLCGRHFAEWAEMLRGDLDEAKAKYAPGALFDPRSLAEHFIAVLEGSLILGKVKQDTEIIEKNLQHYRKYLKTLFGEKL